MVLTGLSKLVTVKVLPYAPAFGISSRGLSLFKPPRLTLMADTTGAEAASAVQNTTPPTSSSSATGNRDRCIFCKIVDGKDKASSNKIIYQDSEFVVFPDIRPATKHHLLVVTKEHIRDAKSLTLSQIGLLDRQVQTGQKVLAELLSNEGANAGADASTPNEKTLIGFHWPPFHTVSHLHLHVISPSDQMGFIGRIIFRPNSYWFVQPDWVKSRLEKLRDKDTS